MAQVGIKELLEAGVHFGHQTRRWNPKMRRFIFGERGGIYIIDLLKTADNLERAQEFASAVSRRGGTVLFVGTKKQARDGIKDVAEAAGMPYVNHRWLGGLLTNFQTISLRIKRLHDLERYETEGQLQLLPTRERLSAQADLEKLRANLGGVKNMQRPPDAVFVIDLKTEAIAVREAQRLRIPIIGLVDTNCDPDGIDYVVPGNDDAIRACNVITQAIGDVVAEGRGRFREEEEQARREAEEQARREAEERERREAEEQARREAEEFQRAEAERALTEGGEQQVAEAVEERGRPQPEGRRSEEAAAAAQAAEEPAAPATSATGPTASPERTEVEEAAPAVDETTPGEDVEPAPEAKPARRRSKKKEEPAAEEAAPAEEATPAPPEEAAPAPPEEATPAPPEEAAPAPPEEAARAPAEEASATPAEEAAPAPPEEAAPAPAEEAAPAPAEEASAAPAEEASQDTEQTQETESK